MQALGVGMEESTLGFHTENVNNCYCILKEKATTATKLSKNVYFGIHGDSPWNLYSKVSQLQGCSGKSGVHVLF
jgi:hypothetical protein